MVQILQPRNSLLGNLGTGLGQGLSAGLQYLADQKMQQMQSRQQQEKNANAFQAFGLTPEEGNAIASLPEQTQAKVLQAYLQRGGGIGGGAQTQGGTGEPQAGSLGQTLAQPTLKEQRIQANEDRKFEQAERKMEEANKRAQFKETKAERNEILNKGKQAKQTLHDLDRFQELEDSGKLDTPGYVEFLKRSGLDIPALQNPESQEFNKIAANFIRGAKDIFGARVTNQELEQFLKTIPNLSQSPEGRKRVIANMRYIARGDVERSNALKELIQENKGVPPYDLLEQVDSKVEKKLDKLSKKLREDLEKPVPKGQNRLITALQTGAGSTLSKVGSTLGGALKGAAIGAGTGALLGGTIVPGLGTIPGAGAGAIRGAALGALGKGTGLL